MSVSPCPRPGSVGTPVPNLSVCLSPPVPVLVLSTPQYLLCPSVCLPLSRFCRYPSTYSVCLSVPFPLLALSIPQYLFRLSVCLSPSPSWFCRYLFCRSVSSCPRSGSVDTPVPILSVCLSPPVPVPVLSIPQYLFRLSVSLYPAPRPGSVGTQYLFCLSVSPCPPLRPGSVGTPVRIPSVCLSVPFPVLALSIPQYLFRLSVCLSPPVPLPVLVLSIPQYLFRLSVCLPLSPSPSWFCRYPSTYSVCLSRPHPRSRRSVGTPVPILSVCLSVCLLEPSLAVPRDSPLLLYSTSAVLASRALGTSFSRLAVRIHRRFCVTNVSKSAFIRLHQTRSCTDCRRFAPPATS